MSLLRVTSATLKGGVFQLDRDYITVGRDPDNTIHLAHTSVSKHHAMVTIDNGDFKLWDLHSTNGLVVNGEKTVLRHLRDGDQIVLGEVELRYEQNGIAPAAPAQPTAQAIAGSARDTQPLAALPSLPKPEPAVVKSPPLTNIGAALSLAASRLPELLVEPPPPPPPPEQIRTNWEKAVTAMDEEKPSLPPITKTPTLPESKPVPAVAPSQTPVPPPNAASVDRPKRSWRSSLICAGVSLAGLCVFGIGQAIKVPGCMFVGLLAAIAGFICLLFVLRYGKIVAPTRKHD